MRTEDFTVIILTVQSSENNIDVTYNSDAFEANVTLELLAHSGRVVASANRLKAADKAIIGFSAEGLLPGTYTCKVSVDGMQKDSKEFKLA